MTLSDFYLRLKKNITGITAVFTVGFPFAGYKFLAGIIFLNLFQNIYGLILSVAFIFLAAADVLFNIRAVVFYAVKGSFSGSVCLISYLSRKSRYFRHFKDAGETFDTVLSFGIVAVVVGMELFEYIGGYKIIWNTSTVVNVLGAGLSRLAYTFSKEQKLP